MKLKLHVLAGFSAVGLLALPVLADENNNSKFHDGGANHADTNSSNQLSPAVKASTVIGLEVQNDQQEKLGKVSDLALDVTSGRIALVIIASGGFLGVGQNLIAVPPAALRHDVEKRILLLNVSKKKFVLGPKLDRSNLNGEKLIAGLNEIYSNYGDQPYVAPGNEDHDSAVTLNQFGTNYNGTARRMDDSQGVSEIRSFAETNNAGAMSEANRAANRNANRLGTAGSHWGYVLLASKLMGMEADNLQGEKLGVVKNFALDVNAGQIIAVIVSSGGYLGIGNELSAIPPTALRFNAGHDTLQLDVSKETFASMSHFKSTQWPDFREPTYVGGVYRAYNVEPYFATNAISGADNTARNAGDRKNRTLTSIDQGNGQSDINTTAQIRKEIVADDGMSTNAKNVKIITVDGRVTLRGLVNTTEEKRLIGEIVIRIVTVENVDNQLEVQLTTGRN